MQIFEIDPFLVQAAAEASPDPKKALAVDYANLVGGLSRAECDEYLTRLAEGEAGVASTLRKRLATFLPQPERPRAAQPRTIQQLLRRAEQLHNAEKKRQAEAARQKHIAEMRGLATREEHTWRKVEEILDNGRKIAAVYDEATGLLEKLKQLSEFQDSRDIFQQRIYWLAEKYSARSALMGRWHTKGWI